MTDSPPTVSDAIAALVSASGSNAERRELRAALSHVDARFGSMPVRELSERRVAALLDELHEAGLSPRRETAILDAVHSLRAFAGAPRPVAADPFPAPPATAPTTTPTPTPTLTMLTLGARVAAWTAWTITIVFALLLVALVLELS
jgi:hypothetical protein